MKASEEGFEFMIVDYLKKSMWDTYSSDHVVMEEINSTILRALGRMKNKMSVFAFIQANRAGYDKKLSVDDIAKDAGQVAMMVDGGLPAYRSADTALFLKIEDGARHMIVVKHRMSYDKVGDVFVYDVNGVDFSIKLNNKISFIKGSKKKVSKI